MSIVDFDHWPYPRWVAHRGAGLLAPENTLAAFRLGASHGYRMFECDVKLSRDGVPFLLHDDTLERTTSGHGVAGDLDWSALSQLDAGSWHSPVYAGEALPTLGALSTYLRANDCFLNLEIKPTKGLEQDTGAAVALACRSQWQDAPVAPLLTSFQPHALQAARQAWPQAVLGLLLDTLWDGWLDIAVKLGCVAVVFHHERVDADLVARVHATRMRVAVYAPNTARAVNRARAAGVDTVITGSVALFDPNRT